MIYTRRKFLQAGSLLAAGTLAGVNRSEAFFRKKLKNFGIQLWTLRDDMNKDPKGVLKQVASYGYTQIESFEGTKGIFWGMTSSDFKKYMDDLGMKIVSSHCDIAKDFEKKAADAASVDIKYLICPYKGPQKSIEDFKRIADEFDVKGEICRKNGIRFAYHNHDYSFIPLEGKIPQEVMMNNTNPETVFYEMDIYWVVTPGADPVHYFKAYKNRFPLVHVKDRMKNAAANNKEASCDLGTGMINFHKVLHAAKKCGTEYFIVEQERYDNSTPLQSAQSDAKYMGQISI